MNEGLYQRSVKVMALMNNGSVLYAGIKGAGVYRPGETGEPTTVNNVIQVPEAFRLVQNYSNIFIRMTVIKYKLTKSSHYGGEDLL
jgi:hypothetical protein